MDPASLRNTAALLSHVDKLTGTLVTRFLNIVGLAKIERLDPGVSEQNTGAKVDRTQAATNTFKIQVETAALVRAAEDILAMTRQMKEMWLFGELNTMSESKVQQTAEQDAKAVGDMIRALLEQQKIDLEKG